MPAPSPIANGTTPDATAIQAWFTYLSGGAIFNAINRNTKTNLIASAAAAPTVPFLCIATDEGAGGQLYCYLGNTLAGDGGFVLLGG